MKGGLFNELKHFLVRQNALVSSGNSPAIDEALICNILNDISFFMKWSETEQIRVARFWIESWVDFVHQMASTKASSHHIWLFTGELVILNKWCRKIRNKTRIFKFCKSLKIKDSNRRENILHPSIFVFQNLAANFFCFCFLFKTKPKFRKKSKQKQEDPRVSILWRVKFETIGGWNQT